MKSFSFPDMFSSASANIVEDREATISNMRLLLASWKNSLFGDPYFGTNLKRFIYNQNNIVLQDLIIDDIYVSLTAYMPQLALTRKDVRIHSKDRGLYAQINCINKLDNQVDLYEIDLLAE